MFEDFWRTLKDGFLLMTVIAFGALIIPSSAALGLHLMTKLVPQLAPTCEVNK